MERVPDRVLLYALSDVLKQPFVLDPGSLEFLAEQAELMRNGVVKVVCGLLADDVLTPLHRENLTNFVRHAVRQDVLRSALRRSTKRAGLCPKGERDWLRRLLAEERGAMPSVAPVVAEREADLIGPIRQVPSTSLDLSNLEGSIDQFPEFLDRLAALPRGLQDLNIQLAEFTYASALAVIAQWILANGIVDNYAIRRTPTQMRQYLDRVRFAQALLDPTIKVSPDPMDWAVGLTRINRESATEKVTEKIVDILTTFVNPKPSDRSALYVLISEMIENVHRHAAAPVDGFAVAQVYPKRLKMGITLVDAGIGVRSSFEQGHPSIDISQFRTDQDFLHAAIRLHATSKRERHSGYGLFLLSELLSRNRGTFLLTSGSATIVGYRRRGALYVETFTHRPWQGTIVSVVVDLQHDLPLDQIYREMPLPEGITDDDLFQEFRH